MAFSAQPDQLHRKDLVHALPDTFVQLYFRRSRVHRANFVPVLQIRNPKTVCRGLTTHFRHNLIAPYVKVVLYAQNGLALHLENVHQALSAWHKVYLLQS